MAVSIATSAALSLVAASAAPDPAHAFKETLEAGYPSGITITYGFIVGFPLSQSAVTAGEQAWAVQGNNVALDFAHDGNWDRVIVYEYIDGPGGTLANATVGCDSNAEDCFIRFDAGEDAGYWTDARVTDLAAHEFGHWSGCPTRTQTRTVFPRTAPAKR